MGVNSITHKQTHRRKQDGKSRGMRPERLMALISGAERQRAALPADSPRRKPTMANLNFMRDPERGGDA
jgi:hypothetical protein